MGLKDLLTPGRSEARTTKSALDAADDPRPDPGAIDRLVTMLLDVGLDGRGPLDPVREVADEARLALEMLAQKQVITLDEERKAAMVSNLMVVLCSEHSTQPVVNTGTLHH